MHFEAMYFLKKLIVKERKERKKDCKRNKLCDVGVPTPEEDYKIHVLQVYTNKRPK